MTEPLLFAEGKLRLTPGAIAWLELNQPEKRNAISQSMWRGLAHACDTIEADASIKVVVVRGAGGKAFSAGADISEFATIYETEARAEAANSAIRHAQARLRRLARPTIAMIEGTCVGGGMGIALACDFRFAAANASFAITPAKLGLAYSFLDTAQLVEKVGPANAKDILFSARMIPAEEALSMRLVERIFASEELEAATLAYAGQIASRSQNSVQISKAIVNGITDALAAHEKKYDAMVADSFKGEDFKEGYRAFLEKRAPDFR